jgi:hypothetical protein
MACPNFEHVNNSNTNKNVLLILLQNITSVIFFFNFQEKPLPLKCFYVPLFLKGWQPRKKWPFGLWRTI